MQIDIPFLCFVARKFKQTPSKTKRYIQIKNLENDSAKPENYSAHLEYNSAKLENDVALLEYNSAKLENDVALLEYDVVLFENTVVQLENNSTKLE